MGSEMGRSFASGFVIMANMLSTVSINKLVVPELVQAGNAATLVCQYSVLDDKYTLHWLFNGSEVYEWRPGTEPRVSGVLEGRLDLDYKASTNVSTHRHSALLHIVQTAPELSGEYTCRVKSDAGDDASQTASMLIFSPESDFVLEVQHEDNRTLNISCFARGMYPQPDLTLEYNHSPVAQQQRVWRADAVFSAETSSRLQTSRAGRVVCRLQLPAAGYSAMRSYYISGTYDNGQNNAATYLKYSNIHKSIVLSILTITKGCVSR